LTYILEVDPSALWDMDKHMVVVGAPKSGKTTFLLYMAAMHRAMGHTVLIRDIGDYFEYLSLCREEYREGRSVYGFLPEGCSLRWRGRGLELVHYDPDRMVETLFERLAEGRYNIVFADRFIANDERNVKPKLVMKFWSRFFAKLMEWKSRPRRGRLPLAFIFDQFNDIGPGRGRYTLPMQEHLVNSIAMYMKDFRRARVRFIASTHTYDELSLSLRQKFEVHVIKRNYSSVHSVPPRLANYCHMFPKIALDRAWIKDPQDRIQGPTDGGVVVPVYVKPKRYYDVLTEGDMNRLLEEPKAGKPSTQEMVDRVLGELDRFLNDRGRVDYKLIMAEFDVPMSRAYAVKAAVERELRGQEGPPLEVVLE
jgi:hypothetical protein